MEEEADGFHIELFLLVTEESYFLFGFKFDDVSGNLLPFESMFKKITKWILKKSDSTIIV